MSISNYIKIFENNLDSSVNADYRSREERNFFASNQIKKFVTSGHVLNIGGGGKRHLAKNLGKDFQVFEIDITGDCDLKINLDCIDKLPFEDNTFDVCCAFDVLEHLENFHLINDELIRVSKYLVLISLPNPSAEILSIIRNKSQILDKNYSGLTSKFYGLPLQVPKDRHRWWFYFYDIVRFYDFHSKIHNLEIKFYTRKSRIGIFRTFLSFFLGRRLYYFFFLPYIWILLKSDKK